MNIFHPLDDRPDSQPHPAPGFSRGTARGLFFRRGFSLVELLTVMAIFSMVAGFTVPALKGLTDGNTVNTGVAELSDLMTLARSDAIAQHTIVRFVVETDASGQATDTNLRRVSLWSWDTNARCFLQMTAWQPLPTGLILEPGLPAYVNSASYAQTDGATVQGDCVLGSDFASSAAFDAATNSGNISTRYIDFHPTGSVTIPGSSARQAIFVATQGFADANQNVTHTSQKNGVPTNWAQINVDTLTGRTHIYRP